MLSILSQVRDPTKPISYKAQQEAMINALLNAGVFSSKSTHENQRTGARLAEKREVSIDDIARTGGWTTGDLGDYISLCIESQEHAGDCWSS